jgi:acyl-[acyl-carrier-protein]-phospholipid O-acyltransferase/long-chain-fatty-acid--[acyl-carrier-protein] ligase
VKNQVHLLRSRRFLPLFLTQFLGAFNDNLLKNAMVIMIVYTAMDTGGVPRGVMAPLAAGIFILPFFLFSATAGQLADKYEKTIIIRLVKVWEVLLMALAAVGFMRQDVALLLTALFLMGMHSSFFGPLKYSILPVHLERDELISGNALVEAGTFVAILLGTILGGVLIAMEGGRAVVCAGLVAVAVAGLIASLFIPKAPPPAPELKIGWNIFAATGRVVGAASRTRPVFLSMLGISWFWLVGAVYLSLFPVYVKQTVGGSEGVVTLFLALFSVGIAVGSLLCNKLLKGEIGTRYVPLGAFGMTLFALDLCWASAGLAEPAPGNSMGLAAFLSGLAGWRISLDLFMIAVCGGLYIVPLYAIMQTRCVEEERARVIAANNIINALFMALSAGMAAVALAAGAGPVNVFLGVAVLNGAAYFAIRSLAAESGERPVLRLIFTLVLKAMYGVRVRGIEHIEAGGGNTMIVANHQSLIDGFLLGVLLPGRYSFVVDRHMAGQWWARPILSLVDTHTLDADNPMAIKGLVKILKAGGRLVIFPEGRITITGALMKIHEGPALIAEKAGAKILPVRIDGALATGFSRMTEKVRPRLFPRISITALPARALDIPPGLDGRSRRRAAGRALEGIMSEMMFAGMDAGGTIPGAVMDLRPIFGGGRMAVSDGENNELTHGQLLERAGRIGAMVAGKTSGQAWVGLMLPNSADASAAFLGIQLAGAAPALLDPAWGPEAIAMAARGAGLRTVLTNEAAGAVVELGKHGIQTLLIEEMGKAPPGGAGIGVGVNSNPQAPAAAIYLQAGEGRGKWVVYSHTGLLASSFQLAAALDIGPADTIFSAPPMAGYPGLILGTVTPLALGIKSFQYHSTPPHKGAPQAAYEANATVVFGDAAFLSAMAGAAHEYDMASVRRVMAVDGQPPGDLEREWSQRFGRRLDWLFGWPEAGIISAQTPMRRQPGSAGRPLPGTRIRLEPQPPPMRWGRLSFINPGMAMGFMDQSKPGAVIPMPEGWQDSGRMARLDEEGYLTVGPGGAGV